MIRQDTNIYFLNTVLLDDVDDHVPLSSIHDGVLEQEVHQPSVDRLLGFTFIQVGHIVKEIVATLNLKHVRETKPSVRYFLTQKQRVTEPEEYSDLARIFKIVMSLKGLYKRQ